jgi:hypothetical protein
MHHLNTLCHSDFHDVGSPVSLSTALGLSTASSKRSIAGYPALGELSSERPLLVSGIISSDPRYPANFIRESLPASVLCHSFSWGGMSGSPVLGLSQSIGKSKILGVNCGHIASQGVSGGVISYFARSDALIEMLSSTGESVPA